MNNAQSASFLRPQSFGNEVGFDVVYEGILIARAIKRTDFGYTRFVIIAPGGENQGEVYATSHIGPVIRQLVAEGKLCTEVDTCPWLIQVASNNPEPDFPEDLYRIVECGGKVTTNEHGSWRCEYGHEHVSFSDPARDAYEAEMAFNERAK